MKVVERYLGRTIVGATSLTLLLLISLSTSIKFLEQLRQTARGTYNAWSAGWYTLLALPQELRLFFPLAALLGVLLGLGFLASHSELMVMQALGYSRVRIMAAVSKAMLPFILLCMALGEWVVPWSEQAARQFRAQSIEGGTFLPVQGALWIKDGSDFIYIEQLTQSQRLQGIHIYHFNDKLQLTAITQAKSATFQQDYWKLQEITKQILVADQPIITEQALVSRWSLQLTPEKLGLATMDPLSLSMSQLHHYIHYLKKSGQESSRYELAFWKQLVAPLSTLVMLFLALSSMFGPLRNTTVSMRMAIGIAGGFIFYVLSELFGQLSLVYKVWPFLGAALPSLLYLALASLLLKSNN
jgi:lipopolysaccharide export system permease protein